jgi:hypothetical protein
MDESELIKLLPKIGAAIVVTALMTLLIGRMGQPAEGCRGLCSRKIRCTMRHIKEGLLWCANCEIAISTKRCECCNQQGRMKARQRSRLGNPKTKFIPDEADVLKND